MVVDVDVVDEGWWLMLTVDEDDGHDWRTGIRVQVLIMGQTHDDLSKANVGSI